MIVNSIPSRIPPSQSYLASYSSDFSEIDYNNVYASSIDSEVFDKYFDSGGNIELRNKIDKTNEWKKPSPQKKTFSSFFNEIPSSDVSSRLLPLMLVLERQQSKSCFEAKITAFFRWKKLSLKINRGVDLSDNLTILKKLADSYLISEEELETKYNEKITKSLTVIMKGLEKIRKANRLERLSFNQELFGHWKNVSGILKNVEKSLPLSLRVFCLLDYVRYHFIFFLSMFDVFFRKFYGLSFVLTVQIGD
jgi:hypothetical protein